jgi:hypothetical protein
MRALRPLLLSGLLLIAGLLVGCDQQPPRMKDQPTNLGSGETKVHLPGKKKSFDGAQ